MYKSSLTEMTYLLNDSRIYIEHHYTPNKAYQSEINYHCWFLYENLINHLKDANNTILNNRYLDRHISHPLNILQYYQPDPEAKNNVEIPEILRTHFQ